MFSLDNISQFLSRLSSYNPILTALLPLASAYVVYKWRHRPRLLLIAFPFPLINLVVWSLYEGTFPRITTVLVPFLIFGTASFIEDMVLHIARRNGVAISTLRLGAFALLLIPLLATSTRFLTVTAQVDTRSLAVGWIEKNLPPGAAIILNFQSTELLPTETAILRQSADYPDSIGNFWRWLLETGESQEPRFDIYNAMYWRNREKANGGVDDLIREHGIRYVVGRTLSAEVHVEDLIAFAHENGREMASFCPSRTRIIAELPDDMFDVAWQQVWQLQRPGPFVAIYDLKQLPDVNKSELLCMEQN